MKAKKLMTVLFVLAVICTAYSAAARDNSEKNPKLRTCSLVIATQAGQSVKVEAEIAETSRQRELGLMNRKKVAAGSGMLFVFEQDQMLSFWMKNTYVPLSIAYIDSKGKIRTILDMKPLSLESVRSGCYVRYALEVPQGWFAKNGIKTGDTLDLSTFSKK